MESTKQSLLTSPHNSTQFPHCYSSTQKGGYMGQQRGYTKHGQCSNRDVLPASPLLDKREVILREIEKERIRAEIVLSEIAKKRVLEGKIGKEVTRAGPVDVRVKKLKSTKRNRKTKKIDLMANPDASGSKSKAVQPPVAGISKHPSDSKSKAKEEETNLEVIRLDEIALGVNIIEPEVDLTTDAVLPEDDDKTAKGKWSCDLCQVIAIAVSALNEVLLGRKQKLKEASLKIQLPRTDSSVGKIAVSLSKESKESKWDQLKTIQSVKKIDDPKRTTYSFLHGGTSCEKNINGCEEEIVQNGESGTYIEKEKIEERDVHISELGKSIVPYNVDVVVAGARLELEKPLDTSDIGFDTSLIRFGTVDVKSVAGEDGIVQNGESKPCIKEKTAEPMNCDKHISEGGKSTFPNNVVMVTGKSRKKLKNPVNTSDNGSETSLIQFGSVEHRVSEFKPVAENDNIEEIVLVACPDANKSGSKWTAVTPTSLKDKCKKKHKLKKDSLESQSPGKHSGTGNFSCDTLLSKETELLVNLQSDNFMKDHSKTLQNVQKNGDPKMTKDVLWCAKNQVGTSSDKDKVANENKGRKHNGIVHKGDTGTCDHMEKIDEPVNRVKHISEVEVGKSTFPHILEKQDGKAACVDIIKSGDSSTLHAISPKDGKKIARGEWSCTLCQVFAPNESSMTEHLCGKKHKLKEASLITQRPENDSSMNVAIITMLEHLKSDDTRLELPKPSVATNSGDQKSVKKAKRKKIAVKRNERLEQNTAPAPGF